MYIFSICSNARSQRQRSSSSTSNTSQRNPFRPAPSRNASTQSQRERSNRVSHALNSSASSRAQPQASTGFSIKGKAGPWTIVASNFAPGTTAADIQATLSRDALDSDGQNGLLSCRLVSTSPTVSAELVISERTIADRIISIYNNQLADNRTLRLSYQKQPPASTPGFTVKNSAQAAEPAPPPEEPVFAEDTDMMPVDDLEKPPTNTDSHRYDDEREAAAASRDRRDRESRRDDQQEQDRDRDRDHGEGRRDGERDRRPYEDRGYDNRRYDDRPRYDGRPSYGRGEGRGHYGGGVRGGYARAAGMAGSGGPRGQYRGGYR
jgi:hypothetical protein